MEFEREFPQPPLLRRTYNVFCIVCGRHTCTYSPYRSVACLECVYQGAITCQRLWRGKQGRRIALRRAVEIELLSDLPRDLINIVNYYF